MEQLKVSVPDKEYKIIIVFYRKNRLILAIKEDFIALHIKINILS